MKIYVFLLIFFLILNCSNNKGVNWCGDHPCINKKEKEAYFKRTMIVEIKGSKNKNYKNISEIEKVMQEALSKESKRIKDEKDLAKQLKLEEKNLAKQIKLEEKRRIKDEKKSSKRKITVNKKKQLKKNTELDATAENTEIKLGKFSELVEKITRKNAFKPYPDINDIPN